jgi:cobalamin biosynthesis protein CbiG
LPHLELFTRSPEEAAAWTGALLAVTHREGVAPKGALILRPPVLALGVGCRKAADPGAVEQGVLAALEAAGLSPEAVFAVATVDAKKDEPAIQRFAAHLGVPFLTYPAERLKDVDVKNPSARVLEAVGTPSVSEAAALTAAQGGKLLLPKTAGESWTVAVAMKTLEEDT